MDRVGSKKMVALPVENAVEPDFRLAYKDS